MRRRSNRGAMLIIATGVLTLLAVLAFSFVNLMRIERRASTNYMDGFRADMTAEAGMIRALQEMRQQTGASPVYNPNAPWIYERDPLTGAARYDIPLVDSTDPSITGDNGRTYNGGLDRYKVKIVDTQALIDLNHPNDFARLMDQLGAAIAMFASQPENRRNPVENVEFDGEKGGVAFDRFRMTLEGGRFSSKNQLLDLYALQENYPTEDPVEDFKLITNFVTAHTWRDKLAASPTAVSFNFGQAYIDRVQGRAPINLNAASKVVLTAVIAGIGGRIPIVYVEEAPTLHDLDYIFGTSTPEIQVEDRYAFRSGWIFVPPIDYSYQVSADTIAYTLDETLTTSGKLADIIIAARTTGNGILGHSHLRKVFEDANIKTTIADPFVGKELNQAMDPSITLAGDPAEALYTKLYRECFLDMLCANFNPNWTSAHHGVPGGLKVDKAELVRLHRIANNAVQSAKPSATAEACFNSKGIFEITSLGELLGEPKSGDYDALYAQSEIRTVVKTFESKGHTSQSDFSAMPFGYNDGNMERFNVMVRPDDPRYALFGVAGQLGSDMGSIEIQPDSLPAYSALQFASTPTFVQTFQKVANNPRDLFKPDLLKNIGVGDIPDDLPSVASYDNAWDNTPGGFPNTGLRLLDGFYSSELGNFSGTPRFRSMLRYRANAATPEGVSYQSGVADNYNIGHKKGALEFWYRPDHDWALGDNPTQRISGLFHISLVGENQALKTYSPNEILRTLGTQMFVTRNYNGQMRITRLYYECLGAPGNSVPRVNYREYGQNVDPAAVLVPAGTAGPADLDAYIWHSQIPQQFWPPSDVIESYGSPATQDGHPFRGRWARVEAAISFDKLKHIKANTWHHFLISWNDNAGSKEDAIRVWLNGVELVSEKITFGDESRAEKLTDPTVQTDRRDFKFVRLNQEPEKLWDVFNVGCVVREQAVANSGVFKFDTDGNDKVILLAANGTVDDVRCYLAGGGSSPFTGETQGPTPNGIPTYRYSDAIYENVIDLADRFASSFRMQLGTFNWNGYLPTSTSADLPASVRITVFKVQGSGQLDSQTVLGTATWNATNQPTGFPLIDPGTGGLAQLQYGQRIGYRLELLASNDRSPELGQFSESPLIDDVSVTYFLPVGGDILLKEKVWD